MIYLRHMNFQGNPEQKLYDLITELDKFFDSTEGAVYRIMDPYLNVQRSIHDPYRSGNVETDSWSFLLSELAASGVVFKIITREEIGFENIRPNPPFLMPAFRLLLGAEIEVCQYKDDRLCGLALHDRYIIKEDDDKLKGVHIGPSLADTRDKDVAVTVFTEKSVTDAKDSFDHIWNECIRNKGWKKG